ncbi:MAG: transcription elongation factor GreA [Clostridia bacterium]|nr:transcription elongation factor GreA [Clostridia bacterium]
MADEYIITASDLQKMKDRLAELISSGRDKIADKIQEARSYGDLSENAEYDAAKNEQSKLESEIKDLEDRIAHAKVVDESDIDTSVVHLGCQVKLEIIEGDYTETDVFTITAGGSSVGTAFDPTVITSDSAIGKAVLGRREGETVKADTPDGTSQVRIISIIAQ